MHRKLPPEIVKMIMESCDDSARANLFHICKKMYETKQPDVPRKHCAELSWYTDQWLKLHDEDPCVHLQLLTACPHNLAPIRTIPLNHSCQAYEYSHNPQADAQVNIALAYIVRCLKNKDMGLNWSGLLRPATTTIWPRPGHGCICAIVTLSRAIVK